MSYEETKQYFSTKYPELEYQDIEMMFNLVESLYLSKKTPFEKNAEFDSNDRIATSWVVRAVKQLIDKDGIDIISYSENDLKSTLGEGMLCEIVPDVGVGGN